MQVAALFVPGTGGSQSEARAPCRPTIRLGWAQGYSAIGLKPPALCISLGRKPGV